MIEVNGKVYPLWSQFIEQKDEWIGGILEDDGDSTDQSFGYKTSDTMITDITLKPNGKYSAFFEVHGERFSCGFDVKYGGIGGGNQKEGWLTFSGYGGHTWRIKKPVGRHIT